MGGFAFDRGLLTIFERGEPVAGDGGPVVRRGVPVGGRVRAVPACGVVHLPAVVELVEDVVEEAGDRRALQHPAPLEVVLGGRSNGVRTIDRDRVEFALDEAAAHCHRARELVGSARALVQAGRRRRQARAATSS